MSFKDEIKKLKGELKKAHEEEQTREPPSMYGSIFTGKLPLEKWRCEIGDHEIDIVPFIGGKNHPHRSGKLAYSVDLYVHKNIGPSNEHFVCPKTFDEPCPVCEYLSVNYPVGGELYSQIKSQERSIYLIWVHDTDVEEKKGLQIWDVSKFLFGDYLKELSKKTRRGGGAVIWSEIDKDGKSIAWTVGKTGEGRRRYYAHRFVDRVEDIPDDILDQVTFHLDDYIKMHPTYDEIHEAFYGQLKKDEQKDQLEPAPDTDCPEGGKIGVDWKKFPECNECALWDDCQDDHDKLEGVETEPDKEPEKEPEPEKTTRKGRRARRRQQK